MLEIFTGLKNCSLLTFNDIHDYFDLLCIYNQNDFSVSLFNVCSVMTFWYRTVQCVIVRTGFLHGYKTVAKSTYSPVVT